MNCVEGAGYQCSGSVLIRSANGVALTSSGVQVYGRSTGDVLNPSNPNIATGLALASGGLAEFRSAKDSNGITLSTAILLKNLNISWDGVTDRPLIIELFDTTAGRVELGSNGALVRSALPVSSNLSFYDYATKGKNGTQLNYANNRYFPRSAPSRCDPGDPCRTTETAGLNRTAGSWRSGGTRPDVAGGQRLHEDGDIHAGDGLPDANGNPTWLPGGNGFGVPFPGSKGVRDVVQWSYRYSNIGYWGTRDTIHLGGQWAAGSFFEHNTERTGIVTFGEVSDSNGMPVTGSASYNGFVYGSYASNGVVDRVNFNCRATVTANFATRAVVVNVNTCVQEGSGTAVPISFSSSTTMGTVAAGESNYSTGTVSGTLTGGLSARFFGPANVAGTNGSGPPEVGGAFSLSNSSGAAVVAGFIAFKN